MPPAEWCSLSNAVAYFCPRSQEDPKVGGSPIVSPSKSHEYDFDVDAEGKWDLSDIPPSQEIDVCSSLRADFTVLRGNVIKYSVGAPTTAAAVFKLVLHSLNTLGEQWELLASVERFYSTN